MRSVFYKFINFWPTESGEVASKPKPQKMFAPRFKDGGQRSDARKIHLACWFVHILSTWALNRLRLDTMEFNCLPEEMLRRGGEQKPTGFWSDEGKLLSVWQKNITCTLPQEMHLSFLVGVTHLKEHSGHPICHVDLASTFEEAYQHCGLHPTSWDSHSYHWKRKFN